jgi:hypothetical protein
LIRFRRLFSSTSPVRPFAVMLNCGGKGVKMTGLRFLALCLISALAAFLGAFVSVRLTSPASVAAQSQPSTAQILRTQRLELVDKNGRLRGALSVDDRGGAALALFTSAGDDMVSIGADELGNLNPAIDFFDGTHGTARLLFGVGKDGSPAVKFADADGRIKLGLLLTGGDSGPMISLRGTSNEFSSSFLLHNNSSILQVGNASLFSDGDGGALFTMGTEANKESLLMNVEGNGESWVKAGSFRGSH